MLSIHVVLSCFLFVCLFVCLFVFCLFFSGERIDVRDKITNDKLRSTLQFPVFRSGTPSATKVCKGKNVNSEDS